MKSFNEYLNEDTSKDPLIVFKIPDRFKSKVDQTIIKSLDSRISDIREVTMKLSDILDDPLENGVDLTDPNVSSDLEDFFHAFDEFLDDEIDKLKNEISIIKRLYLEGRDDTTNKRYEKYIK